MNYNFAFKDFIKSDVAKANGINNTPTDPAVIQNWFDLVVYCLQPVRNYIGKPMVESSGYRCPKLNSHPSIKGASNSQHLTGQALDFTVPGMTPAQVCAKVKASGVEFDQLIEEHSGDYHWVHLSYNKGKNRKQILLYKNGKYTNA